MNGLFISWARENGRTSDLAQVLGLEPHFIYSAGRFGLLGRYARQLRITRRLLDRVRPNRVVLMLPPAPALFSFLSRRSRRPEHLAFDLHTGFFSDPKWQWAARASLRCIGRIGGTAVVTNTYLQNVCQQAGAPAIVLHDVIGQSDRSSQPAPYVLCPLSYANDEPVMEILAAARAVPEVEWRLTGQAPAEVQAAAPPNVVFTGFVDDRIYAELVTNGLGIVALTTRAHTMQRAGYEAFGAGVPQVTSDFHELREFYGDSAEYTGPHASEIAAAVRRMADDWAELVSRIHSMRQVRLQEQLEGLTKLRTALGLRQPYDDEGRA